MNSFSDNENLSSVAEHSYDEVENLMKALKLGVMKETWQQRRAQPDFAAMSSSEQLYELLNAEYAKRRTRGYEKRVRRLNLPSTAKSSIIEQRRAQYGLSKTQLEMLVGFEWRRHISSIIVTGACGTGKTDLLCALLDAACLKALKCRYIRHSEMAMFLCTAFASDDPSKYPQLLKEYSNFDLIAIDDFCSEDAAPRRNEGSVMREWLDICHIRGCNILLASQKSPKGWHAYYGGGTAADAVLDRLLSSHSDIKLTGDSRRSKAAVDITYKPAGDEKEPANEQ